MRINTRAGTVWMGVLAFAASQSIQSASAQELSEKSVRSFMDYAWSLTPSQFSKPDGTVIVIDKKKREDAMVPIDVAREVIRVGRLSAHAQVCEMPEEQVANHRSMMRREQAKNWSQQQLVYISQLHLTTIMLLTGKIRLVEKDGDKEVVVEEGKTQTQTCTTEQRQKVRELIVAYVAAGPKPPAPVAGAAPPANGAVGTQVGATGSVPDKK